MSEQANSRQYKVVVNHEEQYSIWPAERENPLGWESVGKSGTKDECLDYIEQVWTDMRPLSLRKKMEEWAQHPPTEEEGNSNDVYEQEETLVERLSQGEHPVEVGLGEEPPLPALQKRLERGVVYIRFPQTVGGTELGVTLDEAASDWSEADFEAGTGVIRVVGNLTLDGVRVRCMAELDLATLTGTGHLEKVETPVAAMDDA